MSPLAPALEPNDNFLQICAIPVAYLCFETARNAISLKTALKINAYDQIISYVSDIRVVRASASMAVDSGLILNRVKPMTLKLVFTASLLDVQH